MKVALCFIISYQHILNKEKLWLDWIKPNKDIINVYFHYKDLNAIQSPWIKLHTIPPGHIQQTTYYNVIPAYMAILSYAYHHDKNNKWFCLLTDSCVPIISPQQFRQMFFKNYKYTIMQTEPAYWDINLHRRANLRLFTKEYQLANDPWFTLSRYHVQLSLIFLAEKSNIYQSINKGGLANESLFAIILQTFKELNNQKTHINSSSTICDWKRMSSPTSPYFFRNIDQENYNIILNLLKENQYAMFLRKVAPEVKDNDIKQFWIIPKYEFTKIHLFLFLFIYVSIFGLCTIIYTKIFMYT